MNVRNAVLMLGVVLLAGCVQRSDSQSHMIANGADIVVTATGPTAPIPSGKSAEFAIKVTNAGPNDATGVHILDTIGVQSKLVSMSCSASNGATCPSPLDLSMVVPKLPNGGSLHFLVTLKLPENATGTIVNSFAANYDLDGDPNNNSVAIDAVVR